jgi:hypothetical protein
MKERKKRNLTENKHAIAVEATNNRKKITSKKTTSIKSIAFN